MISDPCHGTAMPGAQINTGLPELPQEGGSLAIEGFQLNNGMQGGQTPTIPGMISGNIGQPTPASDVGGIPAPAQPGCGGQAFPDTGAEKNLTFMNLVLKQSLKIAPTVANFLM